RYREAVALDSAQGGAVFGLYRVALRTAGREDDAETHARLAERLPPSALRSAVERRLGLILSQLGDTAAARPPLKAAALGGDPLSQLALFSLERAEGRLEEAATALSETIAPEEDHGIRADRLFTLGEIEEQRGNTAAAGAAFTRAAADDPEDPRAAR